MYTTPNKQCMYENPLPKGKNYRQMYGKIKNATNEGVSVKLEGVSLPCNVSSQLKFLQLAFYDNYLTDLHTNTVNNLRFTYPPRWRLEP